MRLQCLLLLQSLVSLLRVCSVCSLTKSGVFAEGDSFKYAINEMKKLTQSAGAKLTASAKLYPWLKPA